LTPFGTWLAVRSDVTRLAGGRDPSRSPVIPHDPDLRMVAQIAALRFQRLAPYALLGLLAANAGVVLAEAAALAGSWSGAVSPALLHATLFGSRFGAFWWLRESAVALALGLHGYARRHGKARWREAPTSAADSRAADSRAADSRAAATTPTAEIPRWWPAVVSALGSIPHLPRRLVDGWKTRTWVGQADILLGGLVLVGFALSGHAAAVPAPEFNFAVSVDVAHLVAESAWVGGLFYISIVLTPALTRLAPRQRARVLALGLPEFSAVAIVSAVLLAATGSLNTTVHLASITQFLTTTYGRVLFIKIEFFLLMVAISAYHAFVLRPRLAAALASTPTDPSLAEQSPPEALLATSATVSAPSEQWNYAQRPSRFLSAAGAGSLRERSDNPPSPPEDATGGRDLPAHDSQPDTLSPRARLLSAKLENWLRREALLGTLVLLCVALLAAFAGSLAPVPGSAATTPPASGFQETQTVQGYAISLRITPLDFGTNSVTVLVVNARGQPVPNATVQITVEILDMDMGAQSSNLQPSGGTAPGVYVGQAVFSMAGAWLIDVQVQQPNTPAVHAIFHTVVAY